MRVEFQSFVASNNILSCRPAGRPAIVTHVEGVEKLQFVATTHSKLHFQAFAPPRQVLSSMCHEWVVLTLVPWITAPSPASKQAEKVNSHTMTNAQSKPIVADQPAAGIAPAGPEEADDTYASWPTALAREASWGVGQEQVGTCTYASPWLPYLVLGGCSRMRSVPRSSPQPLSSRRLRRSRLLSRAASQHG